MRPGETIASTGYSRRGGGKGANQAVAVGRACDNRGAVKLSACIGEDGRDLLDLMVDAGVDVSGVDVLKDQHTGRAIIQSSQDGENSIGKLFSCRGAVAWSRLFQPAWLVWAGDDGAKTWCDELS